MTTIADLNFEHAALITLSMQKDFVDADGRAPITGAAGIVENARALVETFRAARRPILHGVRVHKPDGSNADRVLRARIEAGEEIAIGGAPGAELIEALRFRPALKIEAAGMFAGNLQRCEDGASEWFLGLRRWSAFYQTCVDRMFDVWGVKTIVVCGCPFDPIVLMTVYDALARELNVAVARDAIAGGCDGCYDRLTQLGAVVCSAADVIARVPARPAAAPTGASA